MAKLLAVNEKDPGIAVLFEHVPEGTPGVAQGWRGRCTECGDRWVMHRWTRDKALEDGQRHVDSH